MLEFFPQLTAYQERMKSREEAQAQEQVRQVNLTESMARVMATSEGRDIMRWVLELSDIFGAQFCQDHSLACFREGRKWVGMEILKRCQAAGVAARLLDSEENNG